jgi:3-hydroxy-4-methylanthranilate adenylyltransferase
MTMTEQEPERDWVSRFVLTRQVEPGGGAAVGLSYERDISYAEIGRHVDRWQAELAAAGIASGTTVAVRLAPSFTYIYLLLALWRLDAQITLIDFRVVDSEAAALIEERRLQFLIEDVRPAGLRPAFAEERDVRVTPLPGGGPRDTEHCLVQFTSGSTGHPKIIGRTVAGLAAELERFDAIDGCAGSGDRMLLLNSISHTFGLIGGILHTFRKGGTLVFARRNESRDIIARLQEAQPTMVCGVPFHFEMMAAIPAHRLPAGLAAAGLRAAVSGGEMLGEPVRRAFEERFQVSVGQAYGMTETGIISADYRGRLPGTVGTLVPGMRARIRDGQLEVWTGQTPYLAGTGAGRFADGWLKTFDLATLGPGDPGPGDLGPGDLGPGDSTLTLSGRSDTLVAIGGLKVDLTEVEAVLREHLAVTETVVVLGHGIEAYVEAGGDLDRADLAAWCHARLSAHKLPKLLIPVSALPRTPTGKLRRDREALRAVAADTARQTS